MEGFGESVPACPTGHVVQSERGRAEPVLGDVRKPAAASRGCFWLRPSKTCCCFQRLLPALTFQNLLLLSQGASSFDLLQNLLLLSEAASSFDLPKPAAAFTGCFQLRPASKPAAASTVNARNGAFISLYQ